ncbi:hypothetical protein [Rhodococcus sp. (in: high G+C Gram-positive bacteria)]|uniref:hypothetical protein n=1 Tax=Rhodococcus sp. TaxID=1831 RepID=UPI00257C02EC|nr:hypothetical protein [Rhodococcus sp. (in: high G+C Gram-positive bacteria)]
MNKDIAEHLGHEKNQAQPDRESTNIRNGTRPKMVLTETAGHVPIEVLRGWVPGAMFACFFEEHLNRFGCNADRRYLTAMRYAAWNSFMFRHSFRTRLLNDSMFLPGLTRWNVADVDQVLAECPECVGDELRTVVSLKYLLAGRPRGRASSSPWRRDIPQ